MDLTSIVNSWSTHPTTKKWRGLEKGLPSYISHEMCLRWNDKWPIVFTLGLAVDPFSVCVELEKSWEWSPQRVVCTIDSQSSNNLSDNGTQSWQKTRSARHLVEKPKVLFNSIEHWSSARQPKKNIVLLAKFARSQAVNSTGTFDSLLDCSQLVTIVCCILARVNVSKRKISHSRVVNTFSMRTEYANQFVLI